MGDVGTVKRTLRALSILCLALIVGVSCGDPSRSSGIEVSPPTSAALGENNQFRRLAPVRVFERSRWCATLTVGGVIAYNMCPHSDFLPVFAWGDSRLDLLLLIVDTGDFIDFDDGNARAVATSQHWVAAQLRSGMFWGDVRFTLRSNGNVYACAVSQQLFMNCTK
jgi:hypothetical protein